jgi:hypothetical protein
MQIKIISDGTVQGTRVVDAVSGETIPGVQMVSFMASVDGVPEALMHVVGVQCEILTDAHMALAPDLNPFEVEDDFADLKEHLNGNSRN